jgi:hypothetical protein
VSLQRISGGAFNPFVNGDEGERFHALQPDH